MNIAKFAIEKKVITIVLTLALLGGGLISYNNLSRLEDPEFTIKEALVVTPYPGASAKEVEEEVTDKIEKAVQQLGQLDYVESRSIRGMSTVTVIILDKYDKDSLPQVWDELRRKVDDARQYLPPGAGPSRVIDDYGDVYGVFFAITGDEYTYAELKEFVKMLQRELLLADHVSKIALSGMRTEAVFIEPSRDRMAQLGIPISAVANAVTAKNMVADGGRVKVGTEHITIVPSGTFSTVKQFENLLIPAANTGKDVYLKDIAEIKRGYVEPQPEIIRYNGKVAIGMGISTVSGGNAVVMGESIKKRLKELEPVIPVGIEISSISYQSDSVTSAIKNFVVSLVEAVVIVIVVLMLFMGFRSAALIGFILVLTISGTFIFMAPYGVALERISLGALIIALGMLVDNAIVIVDGMLIKIGKGVDKKEAAIEVVSQTAIPLLGATIIAILAFAAIGTSQDSTGEFCRSLFQVILFSLGLSWVTAVTVTPLLGVMFLKAPETEVEDQYDTKFYSKYKQALLACIRFRWVTVGVVATMFVIALWGFGYVKQSFFPDSTRPQFMVNYFLPQGTHIDETSRQAMEIEEYLKSLEGVINVTSQIGTGALRFMLTYTPEKSNSAYVQFLVDVEDYRSIDELMLVIDKHLLEFFSDGQPRVEKMALGPGGSKIELRISGPEIGPLRKISEIVEQSIIDTGMAKGVRTDWREKVKTVEVTLAEEQANLNGITRPDVAHVLQEAFDGATIGVFRDGDELLPVMLRAEKQERNDVGSINNLQIWSPKAGRMIPLRQVVGDFKTVYENEIIQRRDRLRTITVSADPGDGFMTSQLQGVLMKPVAETKLPQGYFFEWGGEYENSAKASAKLAGGMPLIALFMVIIIIMLFNSIKQPLVILLCVPLALIGVAGGLLATNQPFGFMAILGFLSLSGMLIKNAIVLVDQINLDLKEGKKELDAVIDSGVSRLRPVAMAAATTALGMIPLIFDAFFISMAVTIIAGLLFASVLTMIFVPVLYTIFYRIES